MSLLALAGGFAKRGMQKKDEKDELNNKIEFQKKMMNFKAAADARASANARKRNREETLKENLKLWRGLAGPDISQEQIQWIANQPAQLQQLAMDKLSAGFDFDTLVKSYQATGEDGQPSNTWMWNRDEIFKKKQKKADTLAELEFDYISKIFAAKEAGDIESAEKYTGKFRELRSLTLDDKTTELSPSSLNNYFSVASSTPAMVYKDGNLIENSVFFNNGERDNARFTKAYIEQVDNFIDTVEPRANESHVKAYLKMYTQGKQDAMENYYESLGDTVELSLGEWATDSDRTRNSNLKNWIRTNKDATQFQDKRVVLKQGDLPPILLTIGADGTTYFHNGVTWTMEEF